MDAKTMEFIEERNGFVIRKNDDRYGYHVFHPNFDGVYLDAFVTLSDAEDFCDKENADDWEENIMNGWN